MTNKILGAVLAAGVLLLAPSASMASTGTILYGGVGGDNPDDSDNIGAVIIVNQQTAAFTVVGTPVPGSRLSGVAFDASGALYASTVGAGGPPIHSTLLRVDPDTGALIATIGPITNGPGGPVIAIADLAVQPGTDTLFGVRSPADLGGGGGKIYTINKATAVATLVGGGGAGRRAGLAFTTGGTLYEAAFAPTPLVLDTIDPSNGNVLTSVPTAEFYPALAARPTDAVLFASNGGGNFQPAGAVVTLDPTTGAATSVGNTAPTFIGGLTFRSCAISINGASANPSTLWPPNHKMKNVAINYTATDSCDGAAGPVTCSLSITSNEGTSADWTVLDAHDVQLRAERNGNGNGRIYTVTISCSDTVGSSASAAVTVTVPHDQGH